MNEVVGDIENKHREPAKYDEYDTIECKNRSETSIAEYNDQVPEINETDFVNKYNESESYEENDAFENKYRSNTSIAEYNEKVSELVRKTSTGMWECLKCPYEKRNGGHVREHVEMHIEGFSFNCIYCDKSFSYKRNIRTHERK